MPRVLSFSDGFYIERFDFQQAAVAASQTAVAMPVVEVGAAPSLITSHVMPWAGSIIAVTAALDAASSAGTGSVAPTLAGTAVSAAALTLTAVTAARTTLDGQNTGRFAAGALLGAKLTTDGSWNATTSDLLVSVYVLFEGVQP